MKYQVLSQNVTWKTYPAQFAGNGASWERLDTNEELDFYLTGLSGKRYNGAVDFKFLPSSLTLDLSSVTLSLPEMNTTTSLAEFKQIPVRNFTTTMPQDYVVKMPPAERYVLKLRIANVRTAEPKIVTPEVP